MVKHIQVAKFMTLALRLQNNCELCELPLLAVHRVWLHGCTHLFTDILNVARQHFNVISFVIDNVDASY